MNRRFLLGALCILASLSCLAQKVNGEATYISFSIPGALGTYPMSINSSMTVTGYYSVSSTQIRGFIREADGMISNFNVEGAVWTVPQSINTAGDITGFYELTANVPQGFLRYADGRIVTFDPPTPLYSPLPPEALPVSINDFDGITGVYPYPLEAVAVFTRSREGDFTTFTSTAGYPYGSVANAINGSGAVVGYLNPGDGELAGFLLHPDGFFTQFTIPTTPPPPPVRECRSQTLPEGINADGTIAGWYLGYTNNCNTKVTGGFVMSPNGAYMLFSPPGTLVTSFLSQDIFFYPQSLLIVPHCISIDQAGDIAGSYTDASGVQHGFVRNPYGTITSFDPPEGNQTTSTGINDGGAITGFYHYRAGSGPPVAFIRVPLV